MAIKYKWLVTKLKEQIQINIILGIEKLPSENELCKKYNMSRQTVRFALSILEEEGLIVRKPGSGSFITALSSDNNRNIIALIVSSDQEYYYPNLIHDISSSLSQNGFSCDIFITNNSIAIEREILYKVISRDYRGIIVEGCKSALPNPNIHLYKKISDNGNVIVFINNFYPGLDYARYIKDANYLGSSILIDHLISRGHTTIAGIFKSDDIQGIERYHGYIESLYDKGLIPNYRLISWYSSKEEEKLDLNNDTLFLKRIVQDSLNSCTSVVCYNDKIAYWLVRELKQAGYNLPNDMAIVSFDNSYLSNSSVLPITSLSHKPHEIGSKAVNMLLNALKGLHVSNEELGWYLIARESSNYFLTER